MPETLTTPIENTHELEARGSYLPAGRQLEQIYEAEIGSFEAPAITREAQPGESPNFYLHVFDEENEGEELDIAAVNQTYVRHEADNARRDTWWLQFSRGLVEFGVEPEHAKNLHLNTKYEGMVDVGGKVTNQGFEVYDIGDMAQDEKVTQSVFDTLELVDQLSGGLLSADPDRPRIVLLNGYRLASEVAKEGKVEPLGFASKDTVAISMTGIAEAAKESGVTIYEELARTLTHELLGHALERLVAGEIGNYFKGYFEYSDERMNADFIKSIHAHITSKDRRAHDSQPMREFGRASAAEDLATSVEGTVAHTMDWLSNANPEFRDNKSRNFDAYRRELVIAMLDQAAKQATQYEGTPGSVASELRHLRDASGNVKLERARTIQVNAIPGEQAVIDETWRIAQKHKPPRELIVQKRESTMGV